MRELKRCLFRTTVGPTMEAVTCGPGQHRHRPSMWAHGAFFPARILRPGQQLQHGRDDLVQQCPERFTPSAATSTKTRSPSVRRYFAGPSMGCRRRAGPSKQVPRQKAARGERQELADAVFSQMSAAWQSSSNDRSAAVRWAKWLTAVDPNRVSARRDSVPSSRHSTVQSRLHQERGSALHQLH